MMGKLEYGDDMNCVAWDDLSLWLFPRVIINGIPFRVKNVSVWMINFMISLDERNFRYHLAPSSCFFMDENNDQKMFEWL